MKPDSRITPCGDTIFCDDIRQEVTGKVSLIGVYSGAMYFLKPFPAKIAKLAMRVVYQEHIGESTEPVQIRVYLPGNADDQPHTATEIAQSFRDAVAAFPIQPMDHDDEENVEKLITATFHIELSDIVLTEAGRIRVRAFRGDKIVRLGSLTEQQLPEEIMQAAMAAKTAPAQ